MQKNILHLDLDAFYASVEELDNPNLIGKPVVVSGKNSRSIVTTANYEARKYKIHSAMPLFMAKNLCDHLIAVPMRRNRYIEKSREVFNLLKKYSNIIEQVSIDEWYLDISNYEDPVKICMDLKREVKIKTGLNVSIGISYNKFLAKLASDWNKPNGFKQIREEEVPYILLDLDIKKVHGLGEKSQKKLRNIGINKVSELLELSEEFLTELFGKMGIEIYDRIRGIDKRKVEVNRTRKSMGVERTFLDTRDKEKLQEYLYDYANELYFDLKVRNLGFNTLTIKVKTHNFKTITRSRTFSKTIYELEDIKEQSKMLFEENYKGEKLRLMGISASNLVDLDELQLTFL